MALTRTRKTEIIDQLDSWLATSKLTVVADYRGLTVAQAQQLRRQAVRTGSRVVVAKNRLFKQALARDSSRAKTPTDRLTGMLVYVFSDADEVAPAQTIKSFCDQTGAQLEIVGAISPQGEFIDRAVVTRYASLPGREQQLASLLAGLAAPLQRVRGSLQAPGQRLLGVLSRPSLAADQPK